MPQSMDNAKTDLTSLMNDLKTLADETRVKAHLAGMEAKATWSQLQGRVDDLEQRIEAGKVSAIGEAKAAIDDVKKHLKALQQKLSEQR